MIYNNNKTIRNIRKNVTKIEINTIKKILECVRHTKRNGNIYIWLGFMKLKMC